MNILSCGAGVNSTAIIAGYAKGIFDLDTVVFADTGGEFPETYDYITATLKPFCDKIGLPFSMVRSKHYPLKSYYEERQIIPTRRFRHCTDKFKIVPINQYCKANFNNYGLILGIAEEEKHRAKNWNGIDYPLITHGIDREGCKELIRSAGLPIPRKSGCYFCPFTPKAGWIELLQNHRELYLEAEKFEKNCRRYPELTLTSKPLEAIRMRIESQASLADWIVENDIQRCAVCELEAAENGRT